MKIVGLVGPKRSGKDTAAAALVEQRGYTRVGFADQVKALALGINPIVDEDRCRLSYYVENYGWEEAKNFSEVRRFLQELGTGVREVNEESAWLRAWFRTVDKLSPAAVVVPDVRFFNEESYLRNMTRYTDDTETLLIRITRPGLDLSDRHVSETEQFRIRCDDELVNDGTPEQLHSKVLALVDRWSIS